MKEKSIYVKPKHYKGMEQFALCQAPSRSHPLLIKMWKIMRLTTFLLLVCALHVSAKGDAQKVTMHRSGVPLEQALTSIQQQTGYSFLWDRQLVAAAPAVTLHLQDATLTEALDACLKGLPFAYEVKGQMVYILPKAVQDKPSAFFTPPPAAHDIRVHITDSAGNPLQGASVIVKGTKQGGQTDAHGNITLAGLNGGETLVVSYVGYQTTEVRVDDEGVLTVVLKHSASQLDDMVLKGYYSTTKILNTGNVSTVKAEDIARQPVSDPLMALEGRVPGLYINQTSGVPGAGLTVSLRGRNSIANGIDPLYIVDGIPFNSANLNQNTNAATSSNKGLSPFQNIRPEDIESIEVLKDADATAIYGSRGANGVILITTKKGKEGKTELSINLNSGTGKVTHLLDLMNSQQYIEMREEAYRNDGLPVPDSTTVPAWDNYDLTSWGRNNYTNWQKLLIGGTSHMTNANATISGGNERTQFLFGGSFRKETTVYPGDYANQIASTNLNIHHVAKNKRFTLDISSNYSNNNNRLPVTDFASYVMSAPITPKLYDDNGNLNWADGTFDNPLGYLKQKSTSVSNNLISNATFSYNFLNGLVIKVNSGYSNSYLKEVNLIPFTSVNPTYYADPADARSLVQSVNQRSAWIIEPQITYNKQLKDHSISLLVGTTFQKSQQDGVQATGTGFSNDILLGNIAAASRVTNNTNFSEYRYNALYARIGYNYKEKYVLNLTGRRDGSSRFGPGNQFGNFGAAGAAWIFSMENFVKDNLRFLSLGKLRASVGRTGNDQLPDYAYLSTYGASSSLYLGGTTLSSLGLTNPFYGWETIDKQELGLDLGFFEDKILFNVSAYRNRTKNQLVGYPLPTVTGYTSIYENLPAVIENKGLEFEINTLNVKSKNFEWRSDANISFPRNKLVSFPGIEGTDYGIYQVYAVGKSLFVQYVYRFKGIDPQTGLYTFEDLNDDDAITSEKDKYPKFVGQKFYGGLNNSFTYKGLSLDLFFQFVKQNVYNTDVYDSPGEFSSLGLNQPVGVLDRWKDPDHPGKYQKYSTQFGDVYNGNQLYYSSDAKVSDASFIRLKNVQLAWSIPTKWKTALNAQSIKIYLQGQNLATITKFKGADPESPQYKMTSIALPPLKVFTVGIQLIF